MLASNWSYYLCANAYIYIYLLCSYVNMCKLVSCGSCYRTCFVKACYNFSEAFEFTSLKLKNLFYTYIEDYASDPLASLK
jgi:hypothetical protein